MNSLLSRREFLTRTAAIAAIASAPHLLQGAEFRGRLRRAMIVGKVNEEALKPLKQAGFEGVETTHICPESEASEGGAVADKMGMKIHSVLRGWMEFNSTEDSKVEDSLEKTRAALRAAKAYGADAILLVP